MWSVVPFTKYLCWTRSRTLRVSNEEKTWSKLLLMMNYTYAPSWDHSFFTIRLIVSRAMLMSSPFPMIFDSSTSAIIRECCYCVLNPWIGKWLITSTYHWPSVILFLASSICLVQGFDAMSKNCNNTRMCMVENSYSAFTKGLCPLQEISMPSWWSAQWSLAWARILPSTSKQDPKEMFTWDVQ